MVIFFFKFQYREVLCNYNKIKQEHTLENLFKLLIKYTCVTQQCHTIWKDIVSLTSNVHWGKKGYLNTMHFDEWPFKWPCPFCTISLQSVQGNVLNLEAAVQWNHASRYKEFIHLMASLLNFSLFERLSKYLCFYFGFFVFNVRRSTQLSLFQKPLDKIF